jgi:cyclopropane fatty-acyl-phospholipid synthase-like methyltransferase
MSQKTTGLMKILNFPFIYNILQKILGSYKSRQYFVKNYIKLERGNKILDIGCGTGEILSMISKDVTYVGYDLSNSYISAARARFGDRGTWHCSSVSEMSLDEVGTFDIVIAIGILHHLNDVEASRLIEIAFNALKPNGRFVCWENAFTDDQSMLSRLIVSQDRGRNIRSPEDYLKFIKPLFADFSFNIHHDLLRIPYTHVIISAKK